MLGWVDPLTKITSFMMYAVSEDVVPASSNSADQGNRYTVPAVGIWTAYVDPQIWVPRICTRTAPKWRRDRMDSVSVVQHCLIVWESICGKYSIPERTTEVAEEIGIDHLDKVVVMLHRTWIEDRSRKHSVGTNVSEAPVSGIRMFRRLCRKSAYCFPSAHATGELDGTLSWLLGLFYSKVWCACLTFRTALASAVCSTHRAGNPSCFCLPGESGSSG